MTDYNTVRDAISAAVQVYKPDMNVYHYVPRTLVPPCAIVKPRALRTINYLQEQSSRMAKWNFVVILIIGLVDEQAAQQLAGELISPGSPLIECLKNAKLPNGYATVTEGSVSEMMFGQALYTNAELAVEVLS